MRARGFGHDDRSMTDFSDPTLTTEPARRPREVRSRRGRARQLVVLLLVLTIVPTGGAIVRIIDLISGTPAPESVRFFDSPTPVVIHIAASLTYLALGAFQFVPRLRRLGWHRRAGRYLAPIGLVAALTGVWMTLFYDIPADVAGPGLFWVRLVFGSFMAVAIVLGVSAIRRGDVQAHAAWMIRAYAAGMGAGSQAVIFITWQIVIGEPGITLHTVLMTAGWVVNAVIAELAIVRMRAARRPRPALG